MGKGRESHVEIAFAASAHGDDLLPKGAFCRLHLSLLQLGIIHLGRVDEQANHGGLRHYLAQELQLLGIQIGAVVEGDAGEITPRPVEAATRPTLTWSAPVANTIGPRNPPWLRTLQRRRRLSSRRTDINQIGYQSRQSLFVILRPDRYRSQG